MRKYEIPQEVTTIYNTLKQGGFDSYLVGGCIRNILMNIPVKDWDLTTNATPEEIQKLFPDSFYDNTFGTVGIPYQHPIDSYKNYAEVTTFRTESGYTNLRHPDIVSWGKDILEDLSRRDFTVNAIAAKIVNDEDLEFIDPYGGLQSINDKTLVTVGNPDERFGEDALRMLRAIRFAAQLNFKIEKNTWDSLISLKQNILQISWERIRDEFLKIMESQNPYEGTILLDNAGILEFILPELMKGKGLSQARPGRHHKDDVYTHNLLSLKYCPSENPIVRFATLIHDVGKPYVASTDENGFVIFYNHEVKGAEIAEVICERFRLSKKQKEKIVTLIRWHMFSIDETTTETAVRRFIRRVGLENVSDIIDLRIGDRLGSGTENAESWRLKRFKEMIEKELNPPFSINDLAIDGNEIMKNLNLAPGPKIGKILQELFEEVDQDLSKNTKEYLLERIKSLS